MVDTKQIVKIYSEAVELLLTFATIVDRLECCFEGSPEERSKLIFAAGSIGISEDDLFSTLIGYEFLSSKKLSLEAFKQLADQYTVVDPLDKATWLIMEFGNEGLCLAPLLELGSPGIDLLFQRCELVGCILTEKNLADALAYKAAVLKLSQIEELK